MRKYCILIFICFIFGINQLYAQENPLERKISLSANNQATKDVLKQIEQKTDVKFSYNSEIINTDKKINIVVQNTKVKDCLDKIFNKSIKYSVTGNYIILFEDKQINQAKKNKWIIAGTIANIKNGEKIENVSVFYTAKTTTRLSNELGYYSLPIVSNEKSIALNFSKSGFNDTIIFVKNKQNSIDVNLYPIEPVKIAEIPKDKYITKAPVLEEKFIPAIIIPQQTVINSENLKHINNKKTFQFSILPTIGTNRNISGIITNNLSINLLAGYSRAVDGIEIGGLFNIVKTNVRGFQFAGLGNIVGGQLKGLQIAGLTNVNLQKTNGIQIAGINNVVWDNVNGAQISSISNITKGNMYGYQFSGFNNYVVQNLEGIQMAGFANITEKTVTGIQLAGIANIGINTVMGSQITFVGNFANSGFKGWQIAGISNITNKKSEGTQLAGMSNIAFEGLKGIQMTSFFNLCGSSVQGVQFSIGNNTSLGEFEGVQISALSNVVLKNAKGMQAGALINFVEGDFTGAQIASCANLCLEDLKAIQFASVINYAKNNNGMQIGILNFCDSSSGISLGLFNRVKHGYHVFELSYNEIIKTNISYKSGTSYFYNIYSAGIQPFGEFAWTFGYGLGSKYIFNKIISTNIDVTRNHLCYDNWWINNPYVFYKSTFSLDIKLYQKLHLTTGFSINFHSAKENNEQTVEFVKSSNHIFFNQNEKSNKLQQFWGGYFIGLRI